MPGLSWSDGRGYTHALHCVPYLSLWIGSSPGLALPRVSSTAIQQQLSAVKVRNR
jgi:hypothetical protein